jgi:predicted CoA-binding protein
VNEDELRRLYEETSTIAVVGCSDDETKSGNYVPRYLQVQGYRIVPVNPHHSKLLGERCYPSLEEVDVPVDTVDVFRPARETPDIARQAVAIGARYLWLQEEIVSEEAEQIARDGGLGFVMDRCLGIVHGELGLGVGVKAWLEAGAAPTVTE